MERIECVGFTHGLAGLGQGGKCKRGWARPRKGKKGCAPGFSTEHGGSRRNGAARKRGGSAVGRKGLGGFAEWTAERTAHTGNFFLAREEFRIPAGCLTDRKKTPVRH